MYSLSCSLCISPRIMEVKRARKAFYKNAIMSEAEELGGIDRHKIHCVPCTSHAVFRSQDEALTHRSPELRWQQGLIC